MVWLLWGTGLSTQHAQNELRAGIRARDRHQGPVAGARPASADGDAYAQLLIPSIGVNFMVVQGTEYEDLKLGPGHYVDTANPWDATGRVGIAGHRTTYLHPFYNLDKVAPGDRITLRTEFGTYDYVVNRVFAVNEYGSGRVLEQTEEPSLVLTTCHPKYFSSQRLIVTADRV